MSGLTIKRINRPEIEYALAVSLFDAIKATCQLPESHVKSSLLSHLAKSLAMFNSPSYIAMAPEEVAKS